MNGIILSSNRSRGRGSRAMIKLLSTTIINSHYRYRYRYRYGRRYYHHHHSISHKPSITTTSTITNNHNLHSYALNGGVVEGVWVFHRHGDRTPSRSLLPDDQKGEEIDFWKTKLPKEEYIKFLNERFPVDRHASVGEEYLDVARFPYGFLTEVGTKQMLKVGQRFQLRHCARTRVAGTVSK